MWVKVELTLEESDLFCLRLYMLQESHFFLGQSWVAHRRYSVFGNIFASRLLFFSFLFCHVA